MEKKQTAMYSSENNKIEAAYRSMTEQKAKTEVSESTAVNEGTIYVSEHLDLYNIEWDEDDANEYGEELPRTDEVFIEFVKGEGSRDEAINDIYIDSFGFKPVSYETRLHDHQENEEN